MFDKQARFWVGEFDGEKECAAGNEVSAITRHRIFVCGLGVGEGTANRQSSNHVRAYRTHPTC